MANVTTLTLARALKLKNRLSGRFSEVTSEIVNYNSQVVQAVVTASDEPDVKLEDPEVNVGELFKKRTALQKAIVTVKMMIATANGPIQQDIYDIAEAKGDITFFAGLATTHGYQQANRHFGSAAGNHYVAFKRKADVDAEKTRLEVVVDALQEKIDKHNHITLIDVPSEIIVLAS